eukprot:9475773-Alexandrium_andersonii.AAC.1
MAGAVAPRTARSSIGGNCTGAVATPGGGWCWQGYGEGTKPTDVCSVWAITVGAGCAGGGAAGWL